MYSWLALRVIDIHFINILQSTIYIMHTHTQLSANMYNIALFIYDYIYNFKSSIITLQTATTIGIVYKSRRT